MDLKTYLEQLPRGGMTALAKRLNVSPSYLSQMASGASAISPARAVEFERETGGEVTRRDLFPDNWAQIWPELVLIKSTVTSQPAT